MKVSELTGFELDYWVAKIEGLKPQRIRLPGDPSFWWITKDDPRGVQTAWYFRYSSNWWTGGPIIEREEIGSHKGLSSIDGQPWEAWANREGNPDHDICYTGATLLEAAMRCFVASRFGDEVDDESI